MSNMSEARPTQDRQAEVLESSKALVTTNDLKVYFPVTPSLLDGLLRRRENLWVRAVDSVGISINRGETLGLVGESGSGKSTLGRALLMLRQPTAGSIRFQGREITRLSRTQRRILYRDMQIIFQDPFSSLNPRMTVKEAIARPLSIHGVVKAKETDERVRSLLQSVGLSPVLADRYPHEFSGGQRQRINIARALAVQPKFVVADEPTSALDVSIQCQIINLLRELKSLFHLTMLFISHDLGVVKLLSDRIAIMYLGQVVEIAETETIFRNPLHPYTKALLSAASVMDPAQRQERIRLRGSVPSAITPPAGCRLHPRCPWERDICSQIEPRFEEVGDEHYAACHMLSDWRLGA